MNRLTILVAVLALCCFSQAFAVTDEEIFRAFSLNLSTPGARALGMGGAFIGRADDATAAETNPAGLTILARPEVSFEYRHAGQRDVRTDVLNVPITNLDVTPTPNPGDPGVVRAISDFHASDTSEITNALGFASVVYPLSKVTVAFSRHELINTQARLVGGITASPFHFFEQNDFSGSADISDVNYNFSAAAKFGEVISLGATIKLSDFSFESDIAARQKAEPDFGDHFRSTIDTSQQKVGFNAGILVKPTREVSVGVVYKYEPRFTLGVVVQNTDFKPVSGIISRAGRNEIDFDVPDSLGFGVSAAPTSNLTFNMDVVRVFYSQLGGVETGFSLFTHLLPIAGNANVIDFKIDDGTDWHFGAEYLIPHENYVFALRTGFYRQSRNRFFLGSAANVDVQNFLEPIFGASPGNDFNHVTFGSGFTYGNFQLDFAVDWAKNDTVDQNLQQLTTKHELAEGGLDVIVSSVVRF